MVNYFFLKGHGSKLIHQDLVNTFQDNAVSLSTVKNWLRRFKSGDLSCDDKERPARHLSSLGRLFGAF
jgi:transposase